VIQVSQEILEEEDGPMLTHGLQGLHDQPILLPEARVNWPSPDSLPWRYERFRAKT